ncbi:glycosyl transferases group 1-domain-containing protein [Dioszegia hungarica]|uniref:Chitobiosyldiphosphodolichol beta-mannosyltransferase n=1 Tax=Dioszegia hungarica TaxID=4972 RepID=A0AA38HCM9_9TREE|nr:glycosyl transferases group 1-domain-containing protein [Dioszegia hungarica]KAI9637249.1 glycosyl transferases group 1-domain-containing protein [Dioszegia hungarica]
MTSPTSPSDLSLISPQTLLLVMALFVLPYVSFFFLLHRHLATKPARFGSAIVLVLGDFGRSPRMMYHAKSLVGHGWETVVVAYGETDPIPALLESPHLHLQYLSPLPFPLNLLPWPLRAPLRLLLQCFGMLYTVLWSVPFHTEFMLVQNPPSIPTLMLAQILCSLTGSKLVIDWHNEGWSILGMRVGRGSPLVKVAKWMEGFFGQVAHAHLFVTNALLTHLKKEFDLFGQPAVLYDRPPSNFRRTDAMQQHELFSRIVPTISPPLPSTLAAPDAHSTIFTTVSNSLSSLRPGRPALLVSSTSWTADEDFSLLLTALDAYEAASTTSTAKLPHLLCLITGKGPLRAEFETLVKAREASGRWTNVTARCLFVDARDYPSLLGCADLGVSLHTSSSGRDLPMKIVDMFGCGVPVLAKRFACLGELVKEGKNGRTFDTGQELGQEITNLLSDFPNNASLQTLQFFFTAQSESTPRSRAGTPVHDPDEWTTWEKNWDRVVFKGILRRDRK